MIVSFCTVQEPVGIGVLSVVGMWNILIGENKMKAWVVISNRGKVLEYSENPWGDGRPCLSDNTPTFTVFGKLSDAKIALKATEKYVEQYSNFGLDLKKAWEMEKWEIRKIDIPNLKLR